MIKITVTVVDESGNAAEAAGGPKKESNVMVEEFILKPGGEHMLLKEVIPVVKRETPFLKDVVPSIAIREILKTLLNNFMKQKINFI